MATKIARTGVERETGFLYFLDKRGDVSRVPAQRGGGKQKRGKKWVEQQRIEMTLNRKSVRQFPIYKARRNRRVQANGIDGGRIDIGGQHRPCPTRKANDGHVDTKLTQARYKLAIGLYNNLFEYVIR